MGTLQETMKLIDGACDACESIYMNIHVSEITQQPKHIQMAWAIGKDVRESRLRDSTR